MGCDMFDNHRVPAVVIAIGLSVGILLVGSQASGGEGVKTRVIVERQSGFFGCLESYSVFLNGEHIGDVSSGGTLEVQRFLSVDEFNVLKIKTKWFSHVLNAIQFIPDSGTVRFRMSIEMGLWESDFKIETMSGASASGAGGAPRITLAERMIFKKVASEEYRAVEGFAVQASRSSTWERGVSLSHSSESLAEGGIDVGVLRTRIGKRVADMLASDIREATTAASAVTIDGNVWETLRIDWYAIVRPGKASLEVDGVRREVVFEYIVGYKPVPGSGKRRNQSTVGSSDENPFGSDCPDETTPLSTEQPRGRNPLIGSYR
jgi:hypothetical protein